MIRALLASILVVLHAVPAVGQTGMLETSARSFTFDNPPGVGLRSYSMFGSTLAITHPVASPFTVGTVVRVAHASMSARGVSQVEVGGVSSAEGFASLRAGQLGIRGAFAPSLGPTRLASDELVAASLAAAEVLPFPIRRWGSGSRLGLDATLHLESAGYDFEFLAAIRRYGWFTPLEDDPMRYRLGGETRLGLRVSRRFSAFRWMEVGAWISSSGADRNDGQAVFEPGLRALLHGTAVLPVGSSSLAVRGSMYFRDVGRVADPVLDLGGVPNDVLGGGIDTRRRTVIALELESRSDAGALPLILTVGARYGREAGDTALGWAGLGTEIEVRPPLPGRWYVVPAGRLYRGSVELVAPYGSSIAGWQAGATLRWERR